MFIRLWFKSEFNCIIGAYLCRTHGAGFFYQLIMEHMTAVNNGISGDGLSVNTITISGSNIYAGTWSGVFLSTDNGNVEF